MKLRQARKIMKMCCFGGIVFRRKLCIRGSTYKAAIRRFWKWWDKYE